ncbi:porin [Thiomicrospira pelophila]|uniref:porin n=1 Tax=Thiomicrospira pelophila TaxID=934 RepID=UPI0004A74D55|nr:porin [Thiomicrospira pelophila]
MKKNILAIAIASAVAAPVAMAEAPTVYGQANVGIDIASVDGGTSGQNMDSRNSRVGVKGSEDLGNGLKAVYKFEFTVDPTVSGSNMASRNSYVGVAGGFGTVVMGRHDTPLRMIQPSDAFANAAYTGNNRSTFNGGFEGEDRLDEVLAYMSPDFGGIKFAVAASGQDNLASAGDDQALTNGTSMNVTYGSKKSGIFAAAGQTTALGGDYAVTRATVQYNEAGLLASFMYNAEKDVGNSMTLGAAYKMGALQPKAKIAMITYDVADANGDDSAMNIGVGVNYALGKKTTLAAEYAMLAEGARSGKNADTAIGNAATTAITVALSHKF